MVIGLAATMAVGMQLISRRAMQVGVQAVTDKVFGEDTPQRQAKRDRDRNTVSFDAGNLPTSRQVSTERGSANLRRVTVTTGSSTGKSVNQDCRLRIGAASGSKTYSPEPVDDSRAGRLARILRTMRGVSGLIRFRRCSPNAG